MVFPNVAQNYRDHFWLSKRAILAAKNTDVNEIFGELRKYKSIDCATNQGDIVNYSPEFYTLWIYQDCHHVTFN